MLPHWANTQTKNHYLVICKHRKANTELQILETIRIPPHSSQSPLPHFSSFLHTSDLVI